MFSSSSSSDSEDELPHIIVNDDADAPNNGIVIRRRLHLGGRPNKFDEENISGASDIPNGPVVLVESTNFCLNFYQYELCFTDTDLEFYVKENPFPIFSIQLAKILEIRDVESNTMSFEVVTADKVFQLRSNFPYHETWRREIIKWTNIHKEEVDNAAEEEEFVPGAPYYEDIAYVPPEMFLLIWEMIGPIDTLRNISLVCRTWNSHASYHSFGVRFWKHQYFKHYGEYPQGLDDISWSERFNKRRKVEKDRLWDHITFNFNDDNLYVASSKSRFATWRPNISLWSGKWYYEVILREDVKEHQLGWLGLTCTPKPFGLTLKGVGDDDNSWSWDAKRQQTFFKEQDAKFGTDQKPGKKGSVIGVYIDLDELTISYSLDGNFLGVAFKDIKPNLPVYPACSVYTETMEIEFVLHRTHQKHPPEDYKSVGQGIPESGICLDTCIGKTHFESYRNRYMQQYN